MRNTAYEATNYFGQKNARFFFAGYEALRTRQDKSLFASVPNPAFVGGNFSSLATPIVDPRTGLQFPGNIVPASRFSNFARVLAPTIPAPNNPGANNYLTIQPFNDDADTATVRSDQTLSVKHSLFERFLYYKGSQVNPSAFSFTNFPQEGR